MLKNQESAAAGAYVPHRNTAFLNPLQDYSARMYAHI